MGAFDLAFLKECGEASGAASSATPVTTPWSVLIILVLPCHIQCFGRTRTKTAFAEATVAITALTFLTQFCSAKAAQKVVVYQTSEFASWWQLPTTVSLEPVIKLVLTVAIVFFSFGVSVGWKLKTLEGRTRTKNKKTQSQTTYTEIRNTSRCVRTSTPRFQPLGQDDHGAHTD